MDEPTQVSSTLEPYSFSEDLEAFLSQGNNNLGDGSTFFDGSSMFDFGAPVMPLSTDNITAHEEEQRQSMEETIIVQALHAPPEAGSHKKLFTCHVESCGKHFTTSGHLSRHHRIHTGEKRFKCPMPDCGARFSRQDNCNQHAKTHEQGGSGANRRGLSRRSSTRTTSGCPSDHDHEVDAPLRHLVPSHSSMTTTATDFLQRTLSASSRTTSSNVTEHSYGHISPELTSHHSYPSLQELLDLTTSSPSVNMQPPSVGYSSAAEEEDQWHFLTDAYLRNEL